MRQQCKAIMFAAEPPQRKVYDQAFRNEAKPSCKGKCKAKKENRQLPGAWERSSWKKNTMLQLQVPLTYASADF